MGLGGMFVLQSTSADLVVLRERVRRGLSCRGPALFSIYAGSPAAAAGLPPYLTAAAATESRAFPAFTYDAAAGPNWAARFSLEHNRNPNADWPVEPFEFADEALQRVSEQVAFTYADFVLCDQRYSAHFAVVPREGWNDNMLPAADWLRLPERGVSDRVPYLWAVDPDDRLHRVIVDARLMQSVRRNLLLWHRLQEHAGINDSHAERLLAREKAAWEAQKRQEIEAIQKTAATAAPASAAAAPVGAPVAPAEAGLATTAAPATTADAMAERPPSDEAWIETARCPTCNECQNINDKMFAYNENKQAYIKDIDAGTYRQMVEAAEACQVAIIHPGKPRNPNEPGLAELLERAKPFL
jgi:ferredoxin